MEYTINELGKLAGVSSRTLRYYDEINLLSPKRKSHNGYRIYGQKEVDLLQQILFYREMAMPLESIKQMIESENYDETEALQSHLSKLRAKREQIDVLINNVEKTIAASKGGVQMSDQEKFQGFKQNIVDENEKKYGKEIRKNYGDEIVDASHEKIMGMSPDQYEEAERLSRQINEHLKIAVEQDDPESELAQKICALHKEWISCYWNQYSKEAHLGLTQLYVEDPRFKAYYDEVAEGSAEFLRDAMKIYCR
ncbi:DNA-binding transcriptional regulator, MerR family [Pelagirhabdus alkalitolerans]|uniref:DNA-binding transcriptional regulator, MerR family n=1 Tax=Pelagirhabdus alkalitolerans TaxID=1612202 RepID=A0A1G6IPU4_9BACI|nr:MerR family transcriptional regulator [Pelagirhabdus alkalitolerans]SDC08497.1 DNA-binding transcriptional regulator, MerR family [Pelagirhabdus alkalitolerans]